MERYPFLDLFVSLSRLFAAVFAIFAIVQAFQVWSLGFWYFALTLVSGLAGAFFVLVGADVLACFKAIEQNTRK